MAQQEYYFSLDPASSLNVTSADQNIVTISGRTDFNWVAPVISFHNVDGEVGRLEWADGTLKFTGKTDEAAKKFIEGLGAELMRQALEDIEKRYWSDE